MTDPTLATRPLIPFLQDWLSSHASAINSFANSVGVAPTLVVAGPIQEASTIITSPDRAVVVERPSGLDGRQRPYAKVHLGRNRVRFRSPVLRHNPWNCCDIWPET